MCLLEKIILYAVMALEDNSSRKQKAKSDLTCFIVNSSATQS